MTKNTSVSTEAHSWMLEPEIMKHGGRYGVRLRASAPSIHMIRADIQAAVSPIVGNEKQSENMVNYLLQEFEGDISKIWETNIFGCSAVSMSLSTTICRRNCAVCRRTRRRSCRRP